MHLCRIIPNKIPKVEEDISLEKNISTPKVEYDPFDAQCEVIIIKAEPLDFKEDFDSKSFESFEALSEDEKTSKLQAKSKTTIG